MKDASAGDIPAPQCPVTQGNEGYQEKKKMFHKDQSTARSQGLAQTGQQEHVWSQGPALTTVAAQDPKQAREGPITPNAFTTFV